MSTSFARPGLTIGVVWLLAANPSFGMPTISLMAVKVNDVAIEPTALLEAEPGDRIEVEITIADWVDELPSGVQSYTVRILAREGASSGDNGTVLPLGWDAPLNPVSCYPVGDCPAGQLCHESWLCSGMSHNPILGAYIDRARLDYILSGFSSMADVGTRALDNYWYFGLLLDNSAVPDPGEPQYGGTLVLVVSEFACGQFLYELKPCGNTYLSSPDMVVVEPVLEHLTIDVGECSVLPKLSLPPNCAIDARVPHERGDGTVSLGWNSMDITFDADPIGTGIPSFRTRVVPEAQAPILTQVTSVGGNTLRLTWDSVLPSEHWTCVRHLPSGREMCVGNLPADADQGLTSTADDLEALVQVLERTEGVPPMEVYQCDIDRSARCSPLDLLSGVDLLNGGGFTPWVGASLSDVCPSGSSAIPTTAAMPELGSCCDTFGGVCTDGVTLADCPTPRYSWSRSKDCCGRDDCEAPGACCDTFAGECTDNVLEADCQGLRELWFRLATCGAVSCLPRGACCNSSTGRCVDEVREDDCRGGSVVWYEATLCSQILCYPQ